MKTDKDLKYLGIDQDGDPNDDRKMIHDIIMMQHRHIKKHKKCLKSIRIKWDKQGCAGWTAEWRYFN